MCANDGSGIGPTCFVFPYNYALLRAYRMKARLLLYPFALIYGTIMWLRNRFYDVGILASREFDLPIICVGNLSTGGTGKSPHVAYLAEWLSQKHRIAVLSRGYGRKSKGYFEVTANGSSADFGDEPLEVKRKLPSLTVAVCEDRVKGIERLLKEMPDLDLIIMDDGFQHRAVRPSFSVLLTDYHSPFCLDHILPAGNLREARSEAKRANLVLITKAPDNAVPDALSALTKQLGRYTAAPVLSTSIIYNGLHPLFKEKPQHLDAVKDCVLLTGIANPSPLVEYLGGKCKILAHIKWPDHHDPSRKELENARNKIDNFADLEPIVITTEKDAMRLLSSPHKSMVQHLPIYFMVIGVRPWQEKELKQLVEEHVRENKSNG